MTVQRIRGSQTTRGMPRGLLTLVLSLAQRACASAFLFHTIWNKHSMAQMPELCNTWCKPGTPAPCTPAPRPKAHTRYRHIAEML